MSKVELGASWDNVEEDIIEEEETVFGSGDSSFIQGYGATVVKVTMAKRITNDKTKTEFIELDFINKEEKTHRERFMVRGRDGKTFFTKGGKKVQHFGINKIKSLLKVTDCYPDVDAKKLMASLYGNTEEAEVTYTEFGQEKTEEFTIFTDLIGKKVQICTTSKKENSTTSSEKDDKADQKYVDACIKATKAYVKANPKKKSLAKFAKDSDYVNVYRWFTNTSVAHFCSVKGLFASEMEEEEGTLLTKFLEANDEGLVFDGRTLIPEDLDERAQKKLGINEYGKQVEPDEDADDEGDYEEPEEEATTDEWN